MKKVFHLGNGHTIEIEKTNNGTDFYKIIFFEDGKKLFEENGDKAYIEFQYEVAV